MANEVVAHYLDGRVVKGVSLDVDPGRPVCHIRTPAEGTLEVKLKDLLSGCGPAERGCNRSYYVVSQAAHATRQFVAGGRSETFQE